MQKFERRQKLVAFKNQPLLSGNEIDKKRDELRLSLVAEIKDFLIQDGLFSGENIIVEFSDEGVSSLVCFVTTDTDKYVLKIALNSNVTEGSEALFLRTWEIAGVSVPHVYKEGMFGEHPYLLMEFVDAPTVEEKYIEDSDEKRKLYYKAGEILQNMHKPKGIGFGNVINKRGEFDSFSEWINSEDMTDRELYIKENNILGSEFDLYEKAKEILIDYVGNSNQSSFCHFDYSTGHLFATEPLTVFDPNPAFNNGIIDLGRTLVNYIGYSGDYPKEIVEGYFAGEKKMKNFYMHQYM